MKPDVDRLSMPAPEKDPVFIIGTGRSGTTILGRCLGEHSTLLFIDEPRFINHILFPAVDDKLDLNTFSKLLKISDNGTGKEPMKFLRRMAEHYGHLLDKATLDSLETEIIERCLYFFSQLPELNRTQRLAAVRTLVHELSIRTAKLIGGSRWLVKQPDLSIDLRTLLETFPNARFLHIIRNPFDVLDSRIQGGFQNDFESALTTWFNRLQAIALFSKDNDCLMTVSFEHLVQHPRQALNDVGDFINLTPNQWIDSASRYVKLDAANMNRARNKFSPDEENTVIRAWESLDRFGNYWLSKQNLTLDFEPFKN